MVYMFRVREYSNYTQRNLSCASCSRTTVVRVMQGCMVRSVAWVNESLVRNEVTHGKRKDPNTRYYKTCNSKHKRNLRNSRWIIEEIICICLLIHSQQRSMLLPWLHSILNIYVYIPITTQYYNHYSITLASNYRNTIINTTIITTIISIQTW